VTTKKSRWGGIAVVAVVLAAAAAGFYWRRPAAAPAPAAATTAKVERRTLEITAEAAGVVEPIRIVEVKSRAAGEVLRVLAETGDRVTQGDLLAEIDPRDVDNALAQAQADQASARVAVRIAGAQAERMRELAAQGVVSARDVDTAEDAEASARAQLVRAETNVELARERRGDVTIGAPIDGTVIERQAEPGQIIASATANVSGGTTLFRMADLSEMRVRAKIDETDIGQIQPGQTARLEVEALPGRTFSGVVEKIEPQAVVEQNVTMFPVLVRLDNRQGLLLPGMSTEVVLEIARRRDVLAVPNGAVVGMRDVAAAAAAVGLAEDDVRRVLRAARGPAGEGAAAGAGEAAAGDPGCRELFARAREAGGPDSLPEADRAALAACRERFRGNRSGGDPATNGDRRGERRPGLVFVESPAGPEPRRVVLGLSDWEYTEIVEGAEEGETVLLVSVAQLQRRQQETVERFRQRTGGIVPGTGRR
jgi:HlyD family secretion protein